MAKKDKWSVKEEGLAARGAKAGVKVEMKTRQAGSVDRKGKCSCGAVHGGECPMC